MLLMQYMSEIDTKLENARIYIANHSLKQNDINNAFSEDGLTSYSALNTIKDTLSSSLNLYQYLDGFFILSSDGKFLSIQRPANNTADETTAKKCIEEYFSTYPKNKNPFHDGWTLMFDGSKALLTCAVQSDSGYFGAWIIADTFISNFNTYGKSNGLSTLFLMDNGDTLNNRILHGLPELSESSDFITVSRNSDSGNFHLSALIDKSQMLNPLELVKKLALGFVIFASLLFLLYIFYLKFAILRPINELISAMNRINSQNLDSTVENKSKYTEIQLLITAYNSLMSRIKKLKIDVYEEKLQKQQTEQQLLQFQIKPHFFLNSLNTVLSFLYTKKYDLVEKMVLCLANNFRYMLYTGSTVEICQEIDQTKNYLEIQSKRFDKEFNYKIEVEEDLLNEKIPILSIQTFIENSIKHIDFNKINITISLSIQEQFFGPDRFALIKIDDNGSGVDEKTLELLNSGTKLPDSNGKKHIGIYNVQQRLNQLYGSKASLIFSNNAQHGTHVEMLIPIDTG